MIDQTTSRPASQGPQVTTQYRLGDYNVLAAFDTMEDARKGIEALGRAGIEGKHITLGGEAPDEAALREETAASDGLMMTRWFSRSAGWAAVGAVVGAVVAVPAGIGLVTAMGNDINITNVIVSAFLGALFAGVIFGLIGSMYSLQSGDTWELTFQNTYGDKTIVGVHSSKREDIDKAKQMLETHGATIVRVPSSSASPQEAVDRVARAAR